jgi:hypothetical protein
MRRFAAGPGRIPVHPHIPIVEGPAETRQTETRQTEGEQEETRTRRMTDRSIYFRAYRLGDRNNTHASSYLHTILFIY